MAGHEVQQGKMSANTGVFLRAGASLVTCKPVFSPDSKYLICGCGSGVQVYSVSSGQCVHELLGHQDKVTSLTINPANQYQLLSCSLDKTIIKWDYMDGVRLKVYNFSYPLLCLLTTKIAGYRLLALRSANTEQTNSAKLVQVHLPNTGDPGRLVNVMSGCSCSEKAVALGSKGEVAAVNSSMLHVRSLRKTNIMKKHRARQGTLTCVACHPSDPVIATGCSNGKIILWWEALYTNSPVKTVCHWHALAVQDLTFTAEGSYFLSGGHECVLVKWQFGSHFKDTMPRLGAPIIGITTSSNDAAYALCLSSNAIQVISSNFRLLQTVQGLTRGHCLQPVEDPIPTGLLFDPRSKALVLNGRPGHLQFYAVHSCTQLYNLDIVCQNYISPENLERPMWYTEVERACFSANGDWLATLERRDDQETTLEMRLKFWHFEEESQRYVLNTNVELPHQDKVVSMLFRPDCTADRELSVVTTSMDGYFKLWQLLDDTDIYRKNVCWNCESVGFYRDLPAGEADFSEDGSILAVAFGGTLTLWDPDTNALTVTLTHQLQEGSIRKLVFGRGSCSHLLMCTTKTQLIVWNLLTLAVEWTQKVQVDMLVGDHLSEYIAIFTADKQLMIMRPSSPCPVFSRHGVCKTSVLSAVFVPHEKETSSDQAFCWQNKAQLYFINRDQELLTLDNKVVHSDQADQEVAKVAENLPKTPFSLLMSASRKSGIKEEEPVRIESQQTQPGASFIKEMLETPAHVLPPVSSLCLSFVDPLLKKKTYYQHKEEDEESDEERFSTTHKHSDSDSDSEEDMETEAPRTGASSSVDSTMHCDETKTGLKTPPSREIIEKERLEQYSSLKPQSFAWIHKAFEKKKIAS